MRNSQLVPLLWAGSRDNGSAALNLSSCRLQGTHITCRLIQHQQQEQRRQQEQRQQQKQQQQQRHQRQQQQHRQQQQQQQQQHSFSPCPASLAETGFVIFRCRAF
jgi:mannitol-specific phosphotransferase system IIBC component